ncbi:hypothetical protein L211DRAFT_893445 [Terfezia boudieri ATCC MYA-4762]|uniref:DUF4470 domain-containing protein n=1 Tax=Terfezia boudieri ATCC MYA-4762 TaxID=1051890 RepID=A0A3N4LQW8_9PEZI|nr:hypothetical protein L211DRAFT_893445 [Terfezia boudieri ATCC MYA-4762]
MLHPAVLRKINFFYAFGNTPPVLLTEHLPPEESVNALLLGCGDPRSILYTVHVTAASGGLGRLRSVVGSQQFLHQAEKLQLLSTSLEVWHGSKYGNLLRICNKDTLTRLHHLWKLYAKPLSKGIDKKYRTGLATLKDCYKNLHSTPALWNIPIGRAAGPLCAEAIDALLGQGIQYWKNGTTGYNASEIKAATLTNPTFLYTGMGGDEVMVHYSSNPIECFHIGAALATLKPSGPDVVKGVTVNTVPSKLAAVVDNCRAQFHSWCASFRKASHFDNHQAVCVRFFTGDALPFCDYLSRQGQRSGSSVGLFTYTKDWSMAPLVLDGCDYQDGAANPAPLKFNIIDTSNLTDHSGLLNILLVTNALLVRSASTVLYTESFCSDDEDSIKSMEGQIGGDLGMMFLLFDLAPLSYLSYTTKPWNEYNQRLAWRFPSCAKVNCSTILSTQHPAQLAACLFQAFLTLFQNENNAAKFKNMASASTPSQFMKLMQRDSVIHYARETYAFLLKFVKGRVHVNWPEVMEYLVTFLETDKSLLMASMFYQELRTHMHILGLEALPLVEPSWGMTKTERLPGWHIMPPVVSVVLVVPRSSFNILNTVDKSQLGTPQFQSAVGTHHLQNLYRAIQMTFGKVRDNGESGEKRILFVEEDSSGLQGNSPVIVAWYMPAWMLLIDPESTMVSLQIANTMATSRTFLSILGPLLEIFKAKLLHRGNVFVARNMPGLIQRTEARALQVTLTPDARSTALSWVGGGRKLDVMTIRQTGESTNLLLSNTRKTVEQSQVSPYSISISSGEHTKTVVFPFPVAGNQSRLRIARKSKYIEVVVPIAGPREQENYAADLTPVMIQDGAIIPWNLPRVHMNSLPAIVLGGITKRKWLNRLVKEMLGYTNPLQKSDVGNKFPLAPSLFSIISRCTGITKNSPHTQRPRAIYLRSPSDFMHGIFILVLEVRLDLSSHTILLDTCVVSGETAFELGFAALLDTPEVYYQPGCSEEEMQAWREYLPAITERCRTWKHDSTRCAWIKSGKIPASSTNPLCECGAGTIPEEHLKLEVSGVSMPGAAAALAMHGTRAAISPFFPGPWCAKRQA